MTWSDEIGDSVPDSEFPTYTDRAEAVEALELAILSGQRTSFYAGGDSYVAAESLTDGQPEVNLANGNAAAIGRVLGLEAPEGSDPFATYYSGEIDAEDLLARVLLALADDEGRSAEVETGYVSQHPSGATVVYRGRTDEYLRDRLERLRQVAEAAIRLGLPVVYG
jgi:hypothetical protein